MAVAAVALRCRFERDLSTEQGSFFVVIPLPGELDAESARREAVGARTDSAVVTLDNVSVWYARFQALDQLTLALPAGATGLVGRNGAGKSTLLRLLLGLIGAGQGTGTVLGIPLSSRGAALRRAVGYMPENDAFLPGMKAIEQVALAGELCSLSHRESIRRAHEVLSYTGLGEARYRNVENFSTGMKQRLKLAVSLVHDPALLLLDEPTVGLDPPGRMRMLDLIADLVKTHKKSLIISTHLLADIQHTCDYVVMIERGRLMTSGRLSDVVGSGPRRYRIQWEGGGASFLEGLRHRGVGVTVRADAMSAGSKRREAEATIDLPESVEPRELFQWAHESGALLRSLDREIEELSELYHRLLRQESARV